MSRKLATVLLAVSLVVGCSGPSKLTEKSEKELAQGDAWRAWQLATRALDKEPGNPRARSAATAAGASIVQEWQRRIRALAEVDTLKAAEEVLEMTEFRENAAPYATIPMGGGWPAEEQTLRRAAVQAYYQRGLEAAKSGRPKKAYSEYMDAERFVSGYRDLAKRADKAMSDAVTRVVVVPFRGSSSGSVLGVQVAQAWREDLVQRVAPPAARFTRILGGDAVERSMTVADLAGVSRGEAIRLARNAGADRAVWGTIGQVESSTKFHFFRDTIARKVVVRDPQGRESVQWIDVPIEVVARVRDVTVNADYEVIDVDGGASLAQRHVRRSTSARVVWTSYDPEGDPSTYALVSETVRTSNPNRVKDVESRWSSVCGSGTTVTQVLEARQKSRNSGHYAREALPRFVAGAAFVFLEELPPAEDLAYAALSQGSSPVLDDILRLDPIDDVDLSLVPQDRGRSSGR